MDNIRLVLVAPKFAGNVGSVARVAANFDVSDIWIVSPQCDVRDEMAVRMATGPSVANLERITVVTDLKEALADCEKAIAIARRVGDLSAPVLDFGDYPGLVIGRGAASRVALVFGREDNCLTVEEMFLCSHQMPIPTSDFMPTMNLSHAVAVVLSRLFHEKIRHPDFSPPPEFLPAEKQPATISEFEGLLTHWEAMLRDAEIDKAGNPERVLLRLRRALQKADLTVQEIALFRALLSKTQVALGTRKRIGHNSQ